MQEKVVDIDWGKLSGFFESKERELRAKGSIMNAMCGGGCTDNACSSCSDCGESCGGH